MTMTGRGRGLKDLDIMLKFKQEIHKNGEDLPGNTKIPVSYWEFG